MSDIKVIIPKKDEQLYVNYLCDKVKEAIHNKKACIVIYDTPDGTNISPSGSPVDLLTSLAAGALSVIDTINHQTNIPKQAILDSFVQVITNDDERCKK